MAESIVQDVVNQSRSVGDISPSDAAATTTTTDSKPLGDANGATEVATKENGVHTTTMLADLDDASARSDTDTSRAEGSVTGDKSTETKPLKKFAPAKPVSFAKYTAPKVVAANAAAKGVDKGIPHFFVLSCATSTLIRPSSPDADLFHPVPTAAGPSEACRQIC
jgi:hypothetical protein